MASSIVLSIMDKEEEGEERLEITPAKALMSHPPRPKKRSALNIVRAALFMARRNKTTQTQVDVVRSGGKNLWKCLVGSMRPLHHHHNHHLTLPLSMSPTPMIDAYVPPPPPEAFHDVLLPPPSPASSVGGMSRYASAEDLREFDHQTDQTDEDGLNGDQVEGEVNPIDLKAEEFIASFYKQMMVERMAEMDGQSHV